MQPVVEGQAVVLGEDMIVDRSNTFLITEMC